ncbi:MAG: response regulator [Halobellus sp.]|uniref:response regulator n=1 Tax=Halobellus sp. TaxID=1979212 RepID=UPI0035D49D89
MGYIIETVLIVEDEVTLADHYAEILNTKYDVVTAYSGTEALEVEESVDAVFLDRKIPGPSGGEVLERLRDRGHDYPVAMLTAVRPDWDIVEMGFDDYLLKPVGIQDLLNATERLETLGAIEREVRNYIRKNIKQASLEGEKDASKLASSEAFETLKSDVSNRSSELGDVTADLSQAETELIIDTISRNLDSSKGGSTGRK